MMKSEVTGFSAQVNDEIIFVDKQSLIIGMLLLYLVL